MNNVSHIFVFFINKLFLTIYISTVIIHVIVCTPVRTSHIVHTPSVQTPFAMTSSFLPPPTYELLPSPNVPDNLLLSNERYFK